MSKPSTGFPAVGHGIVVHMQRLVLLIVFSLLIVDHSDAANESFKKFKRGAINVLTSPVEVPKQIRAYWIEGSEKTFHISAWIFCGLVKGIVMTPARAVSGVWDIVTFPLDVPKNHETILKPAYVFDEWPQRKEGVVYKNLGDK